MKKHLLSTTKTHLHGLWSNTVQHYQYNLGFLFSNNVEKGVTDKDTHGKTMEIHFLNGTHFLSFFLWVLFLKHGLDFSAY